VQCSESTVNNYVMLMIVVTFDSSVCFFVVLTIFLAVI